MEAAFSQVSKQLKGLGGGGGRGVLCLYAFQDFFSSISFTCDWIQKNGLISLQ